MNKYYIYDLESYPNIFTFCGKFQGASEYQLFEISDRMNEASALLNWLYYLQNSGVEMVGFNNIGYDYFHIHEFMTNPYQFTYRKAQEVNNTIILGNGFDRIKVSDRFIPQIDLYKINHFDNKNKKTSLKALQFAMRSHSLEDLPFDFRDLNDEEKNKLREYNLHDVLETEKFLGKCEHMIDMRREYLNEGILFGDVLNFSDVKIGTEYLINRIGKNKCFSGNKPRQTFRTEIRFADIILPKIEYRTNQFNETLSWFKSQTHYIKSEQPSPSLETTHAGLKFHFGIGGIHASRENAVYQSNETHQIIDIDVEGMYPAVAIANGFAPEHLGASFIEAYKQIKLDRAKYPKGTSRNAALKLAGNGAYGNSNNPFSALYDPKYTFSVTVNGQLQLLQLVEMFDLIPELEIIQANTDGVTVYINKEFIPLFKMWCKIWEDMTGLKLEEVYYSRMWIRDVNNYISEKMNGELKRKGAYWYPITDKDYEGWWNKNFSNHASIMAAEKAMTHSWPVEMTLRLIQNPFDFMLRYKATGQSNLYIGDKKQLRTVRYYVSKAGAPMKKVSPPKGEIGQFKRRSGLKDSEFNKIMSEIGKNIWDARIHTKNKSKYAIAETSVQSGRLVKNCNVASDFNWGDVDWDYYVEEAKKLIIGSK